MCMVSPDLPSRMSRNGRTSDSWSDLTFSEIHRRVAWGMVVLLAGTGIGSCNHQSFAQGGRRLSIPGSRSNLWISECHSSLNVFAGRPFASHSSTLLSESRGREGPKRSGQNGATGGRDAGREEKEVDLAGRSNSGQAAAESLVQRQPRRLPAPLDGPLRDAEDGGGLGLLQALVEEQVHDLALRVRQRLNLTVELGPVGQPARVVGLVGGVQSGGFIDAGVAGDVGPQALGPRVVPCQVDQLATDLHGREAEEVTGRRGGDVLQRPAEPEDRVLEDVVGLLPAVDAGEALEHFAGEALEAVDRAGEQGVTRRGVSGAETVDPPLDQGRLILALGHGARPSTESTSCPVCCLSRDDTIALVPMPSSITNRDRSYAID